MDIQKDDYSVLDEITSPVQEVVKELQGYTNVLTDENETMQLSVDSITINTALELDVHVDESGKVTLGTVSRHVETEITDAPILHKLSITIAES